MRRLCKTSDMGTQTNPSVKNESLKNQFLISMPAMLDPNFVRTVTLICQHDDKGAMGLIINRPLNMTVGEVLEQLEIDKEETPQSDLPIYSGGPVQTSVGMILHNTCEHWESTMQISDELALTTSKDILNDIAKNEGPDKSMLVLGYAGWGAGQLDEEIAANAWLTVPATPAIIFDTPVDQRWLRSGALVGVNIHQISAQTGHA